MYSGERVSSIPFPLSESLVEFTERSEPKIGRKDQSSESQRIENADFHVKGEP